MAHSGWQHESQLAAGGFFVESHAGHQFINRRTLGCTHGQPDRFEQLHLPPRGVFIDPTKSFGQAAGLDHPDRDRLAVQQLAITSKCFVGMSERVSVVEHGSDAGCFAFVLLDNLGLQLATAYDHGLEQIEVSVAESCDVVFEVIEEVGIENHSVLDHFGQPAAVVSDGQRFERRGIDEHTGRLVEGTDQVFGPGVIDGNFASDRAVDLCQQSGGDLYESDASGVSGCNKPGHIPDHSTSNGHNQRLAIGGQFDQRVVHRLGHGE